MACEHGIGFFFEIVLVCCIVSVCHGVSAFSFGSVSGADQVVDYLAVGFVVVGGVTLGAVGLSLVLILVGPGGGVSECDGGWWTAFFVG